MDDIESVARNALSTPKDVKEMSNRHKLREHETDGDTCWCNPRVEKVYAEPLLFNLRRLVDEYGYRGVQECLEERFGPKLSNTYEGDGRTPNQDALESLRTALSTAQAENERLRETCSCGHPLFDGCVGRVSDPSGPGAGDPLNADTEPPGGEEVGSPAHSTEGTDCWCNPRVEQVAARQHVIHRYKDVKE